MKIFWFLSGTIAGVVGLSVAMGAVPSRITDDTAIYQHLSEIKAPPKADLNFDSDIEHLSKLQPHYREKLPAYARDLRVASPMKRISQRTYRYSGSASVAKRQVSLKRN